jgi:DNA-binding transcriptional MerR regulator
MDADEELLGIGELAARLNVTARTLRFYEDRGLIEPQRVGTTRIYTRREAVRMDYILRGKRLGFSLRDIREFLDLYDADPRQIQQTRALLHNCRERMADLAQQKLALEQTLEELRSIESQACAYLAEVEAGG